MSSSIITRVVSHMKLGQAVWSVLRHGCAYSMSCEQDLLLRTRMGLPACLVAAPLFGLSLAAHAYFGVGKGFARRSQVWMLFGFGLFADD